MRRTSETDMNVPQRPRMGQVRQNTRLGLTDLYQHTHTHSVFVYWHRERVSVCIERRVVSEPSSLAHPLLHLSFSLSDISPFSSNHFLPFGPLFFLMQLSLIPPFLSLSLSNLQFLLLPSFSSSLLFYPARLLAPPPFFLYLFSHVLANNTVSTIVSCTYCSSLFALTWHSPLFWSVVISLPYPRCVTKRFSLINITLQMW